MKPTTSTKAVIFQYYFSICYNNIKYFSNQRTKDYEKIHIDYNVYHTNHFFTTGCSFDLDKFLSKIEGTTTSQEETPTYRIILSAIENKDFEMFKSVYSDYALEKAVDIEEGFEYIVRFVLREF